MDRVRIGIVGAGGIVRQRHVPGLMRLGCVEIRAVANRRRESAEVFVRDFGLGAEVVGDWKELVGRDDIDVVWIGAWPCLHESVTVAALEAGKHVFCQARMAMDLASARRMLEAARRRGDLVTMLCPPPHGLREDLWMKELIAGGAVGEVESLRLLSLNGAFRDAGEPLHWRQRPELSGKNILTLGIHAEVLHRWVGRFRVIWADGRVRVPFRGGERVRVPDELVVAVEGDGGWSGLLDFSGVWGGGVEERLEVRGSEGVLFFDYLSGRVERVGADGRREVCEAPAGLLREWRVEEEFIEAVRNSGGERPRPSFEDGVAYMEVVEGVSEKLAEGGWLV